MVTHTDMEFREDKFLGIREWPGVWEGVRRADEDLKTLVRRGK